MTVASRSPRTSASCSPYLLTLFTVSVLHLVQYNPGTPRLCLLQATPLHLTAANELARLLDFFLRLVFLCHPASGFCVSVSDVLPSNRLWFPGREFMPLTFLTVARSAPCSLAKSAIHCRIACRISLVTCRHVPRPARTSLSAHHLRPAGAKRQLNTNTPYLAFAHHTASVCKSLCCDTESCLEALCSRSTSLFFVGCCHVVVIVCAVLVGGRTRSWCDYALGLSIHSRTTHSRVTSTFD